MEDLNRIKVVLAEKKKKTGRWLAQQFGKKPQLFQNGVQIQISQIFKLLQKLQNY